MAKRLDDIEKRIDFQVPEGYFEDLPMKIQKRIELEKPKRSSLRVPSWSMAMAASVLLILGFFLIWNENETSVEDLLAEIPEEELMAYVEELNLDAYDLASAFPETTEELEFEDIEMMEEWNMEDLPIDDILLEYNIEEEKLEI